MNHSASTRITSEELKKVLGDNVRRFRTNLGWTQSELSARSKLNRSYIGGIERGRRNVSLVTLGKLANALQVLPDQLLRDES